MINEQEIEKAFVTIEVAVQWGDMDAAQHVNNTIYLRWIESARLEMFKKLNSGIYAFGKVAPILAWQDCKYIFPLTYPDTALIILDVSEILPDRIQCHAKIFSKTLNRLAVISNCTLKAYDTEELKKLPIPAKWTEQFVAFYGNDIIKKMD